MPDSKPPAMLVISEESCFAKKSVTCFSHLLNVFSFAELFPVRLWLKVSLFSAWLFKSYHALQTLVQ